MQAEPKSFSWGRVVFLVGFVVTIAFFTTPMPIRREDVREQREATNNARILGMALKNFEEQYGSFPSAATIPEVKRRTGTKWNLTDVSSNDLLKQLLVTGIVKDEKIFYAKGEGIRKGDDRCDNEADALTEGECGFTYIPGDSKGDPLRPVLISCLVPGTRRGDGTLLRNKAVVLRADQSVQSSPIRATDGRLVAQGGIDLLDFSQEWWRGMPPVLKWPEKMRPVAAPSIPYLPIGAAVVICLVVGWTACEVIRRKRASE